MAVTWSLRRTQAAAMRCPASIERSVCDNVLARRADTASVRQNAGAEVQLHSANVDIEDLKQAENREGGKYDR